MFVDRYEHSLDPKHRIVLPSKFRDELGALVYLAPQDNSLAVYSESQFQDVAGRLADRNRSGDTDVRLPLAFASSTVETKVDTAGRITIPQRLRELAQLEKEVIVAGAIFHVEIWDRDTFESMDQNFDHVVSQEFRTGGSIN